jgi:hypothetical protein
MNVNLMQFQLTEAYLNVDCIKELWKITRSLIVEKEHVM